MMYVLRPTHLPKHYAPPRGRRANAFECSKRSTSLRPCGLGEVGFFTILRGRERTSFVNSTEGGLFDDPYGDGQDNFEYTTYAGDPKLPFLITTILKNHFGFKENSHLVAHTYCEVDYFRKDPASCASHQVKS